MSAAQRLMKLAIDGARWKYKVCGSQDLPGRRKESRAKSDESPGKKMRHRNRDSSFEFSSNETIIREIIKTYGNVAAAVKPSAPQLYVYSLGRVLEITLVRFDLDPLIDSSKNPNYYIICKPTPAVRRSLPA